ENKVPLYTFKEFPSGGCQVLLGSAVILNNAPKDTAEWLCKTLNEHRSLKHAAVKTLPILEYFADNDTPFTEEECDEYEDRIMEVLELMRQAVGEIRRN